MDGYYWKLRVGAKYDPNQPRVPAGSPGGGRWTATGGSTGPSVPPLPKTFKNASAARYWLDTEAFPKKEGKAVTGLGLLSDEQAVKVAETVRDLMQQVPTPYLVNRLTIKEGVGSRYDPSGREIIVDVSETLGKGLDAVRSGIEAELGSGDYLSLEYRQHLKAMSDALDSGDYKKLHTMYWFGEARNLESIVRHEWGHAVHEVFKSRRDYGRGPAGIDTLYEYGTPWEDKYGITARARDNWLECVAENFVAWSTGNAGMMDPAMAKRFDDIAEFMVELGAGK